MERLNLLSYSACAKGHHMRRFELIEQVEQVLGSGVGRLLRHGALGRIGTSGQTKTTRLGAAAAAQKFHDMLVKEKTNKGYVEVSVGVGVGTRLAAADAPSTPMVAPAAIEPPLPSISPAPAAPEHAAPELLPSVLREPPWLREKRAVDLPTLDVAALSPVERIDSTAQTRRQDAEASWHAQQDDTTTQRLLIRLHITPAGRARAGRRRAAAVGRCGRDRG